VQAPRGVALPAALVALLLAASAVTDATGAKPAPRAATLVAVGDIADCDTDDDEAVARLVAKIPGTLAVLGDAAYPDGRTEDFRECYLPAWGRFLPRTRAALGNHEYHSDGAAPAKAVFRLPASGWYSYNLGAWHVVVLNSNCDEVGCDEGEAQWSWLRADLARNRARRCTLAYWHHPRYSSGKHGSDSNLEPFWQLLSAAKADLVLAGHDHTYERFGPVAGIRSFVVGTGGRSHYPLSAPRERGSRASNNDTFGVLRLTLMPTGWSWRFVPVAGRTFADSGTARCH
jgi:alkaline phosphatase